MLRIVSQNITRQEAIQLGVQNAVDTVVADKAMTTEQAFRMLTEFVSETLNNYGFGDNITETDLKYAQSLWPI
ncbi:MAG: hypothetical protein ACXAC5_03360 [Promethearchaeota archaeon]|jgi:hypothetical protein